VYLWSESARIPVKALLGLLSLPFVVKVVVAVGAVAVEAELAVGEAVAVPGEKRNDYRPHSKSRLVLVRVPYSFFKTIQFVKKHFLSFDR